MGNFFNLTSSVPSSEHSPLIRQKADTVAAPNNLAATNLQHADAAKSFHIKISVHKSAADTVIIPTLKVKALVPRKTKPAQDGWKVKSPQFRPSVCLTWQPVRAPRKAFKALVCLG